MCESSCVALMVRLKYHFGKCRSQKRKSKTIVETGPKEQPALPFVLTSGEVHTDPELQLTRALIAIIDTFRESEHSAFRNI